MNFINKVFFDNPNTKFKHVIKQKKPLDKEATSHSNTSNKRPKINYSNSSTKSTSSSSLSTKLSSSKRRVNNVNVIRGKVFQNQINDETLQVNKYNVIVEMIDITNFATLYSRNVH